MEKRLIKLSRAKIFQYDKNPSKKITSFMQIKQNVDVLLLFCSTMFLTAAILGFLFIRANNIDMRHTLKYTVLSEIVIDFKF